MSNGAKIMFAIILCGVLAGLIALFVGKVNFSKVDTDSKTKKETFLHVYKINADLSQDDFLSRFYDVDAVFDPSAEEVSMLIAGASEHLRALVSYEGVPLDPSVYSMQYIGVMIHGKRAIYLHMWRDGSVKVDPVNEYVTQSMLDGGDSFIDGIFELETKSLRLSPHGEA